LHSRIKIFSSRMLFWSSNLFKFFYTFNPIFWYFFSKTITGFWPNILSAIELKIIFHVFFKKLPTRQNIYQKLNKKYYRVK
jgi:hypothetical protein